MLTTAKPSRRFGRRLFDCAVADDRFGLGLVERGLGRAAAAALLRSADHDDLVGVHALRRPAPGLSGPAAFPGRAEPAARAVARITAVLA